MIDYIIFHQATGEIRQSGQTGNIDGMRASLPSGCQLLEGVSRGAATHIAGGQPVVRQRGRSYIEQRLDAYPEIGDQLDALADLAAALRAQGITLPPKAETWLEEIQVVKANYPKAPL